MPESESPSVQSGIAQLLATLIGDPVKEGSALIADEVRLLRWKNQLRILERAKAFMEHRGIAPKRVSLKVLVPLVESASLEDEPVLQDMWARLLAEACTLTAEKTFLFVATEILKCISREEAHLLRSMFTKWKEVEKIHFASSASRREMLDDAVMFGTGEVLTMLKVPKRRGRVILDNLMRLNLVRYEVPNVEFGDLDGKTIDVSFPERVHLTELAIEIMEVCGRKDGEPGATDNPGDAQ